MSYIKLNGQNKETSVEEIFEILIRETQKVIDGTKEGFGTIFFANGIKTHLEISYIKYGFIICDNWRIDPEKIHPDEEIFIADAYRLKEDFQNAIQSVLNEINKKVFKER
ncbi:hypothetical protein [Clostridium sp. IODB-O3]|jgi:hypothetical protein|nr:MAG TPA_asm: hypothetical protein [Caudoviricetes sp.]